MTKASNPAQPTADYLAGTPGVDPQGLVRQERIDSAFSKPRFGTTLVQRNGGDPKWIIGYGRESAENTRSSLTPQVKWDAKFAPRGIATPTGAPAPSVALGVSSPGGGTNPDYVRNALNAPGTPSFGGPNVWTGPSLAPQLAPGSGDVVQRPAIMPPNAGTDFQANKDFYSGQTAANIMEAGHQAEMNGQLDRADQASRSMDAYRVASGAGTGNPVQTQYGTASSTFGAPSTSPAMVTDTGVFRQSPAASADSGFGASSSPGAISFGAQPSPVRSVDPYGNNGVKPQNTAPKPIAS